MSEYTTLDQLYTKIGFKNEGQKAVKTEERRTTHDLEEYYANPGKFIYSTKPR